MDIQFRFNPLEAHLVVCGLTQLRNIWYFQMRQRHTDGKQMLTIG